MRTAIVLLTRDLRIRDNPALAAAADSAEQVIPLFVIDDGLTAARTPNRTALLLDALSDLRASLRGLGADLVLRRGDPVAETVDLARRFDAGAIFLASDHTPAAIRRRDRMRAAAETHRVHVRSVDGPTVIEPGAITVGLTTATRLSPPDRRPRRGRCRVPGAPTMTASPPMDAR